MLSTRSAPESSLGSSGIATAGALLGKTAHDGKPTAYACIGPQEWFAHLQC